VGAVKRFCRTIVEASLFAFKRKLKFVMRGLAPRIPLPKKMDCRVKPGNDALRRFAGA